MHNRPARVGARLAAIGHLEVSIAQTPLEKAAAFGLRHAVFAGELGARLPASHAHKGLDIDALDAHCDHLIVTDTTLPGIAGAPAIVGTCRLLRAGRAHQGFYAASEFEIGPLLSRQSHLEFCEVGRSCIAPTHRALRTIEALWCGLWAYAVRHDIDVYFGTASFPGTDPRAHAEPLAHLHHAIVPAQGWSVEALPGRRVPINRPGPPPPARRALRLMPPLLRGYLAVNALVSRSAYVDHAFQSIDVLVMARLAHMPQSYRRHFAAVTGVEPQRA